jgi:hypothetical protein
MGYAREFRSPGNGKGCHVTGVTAVCAGTTVEGVNLEWRDDLRALLSGDEIKWLGKCNLTPDLSDLIPSRAGNGRRDE